jgi:branched-chain amino acid aminotransferase
MNIFMVRDGEVITPPITDNILEGITRRSVMELLRQELGLTLVERPIDRTEVYLCDEFFMTGTAAQITAVTRVDYRPIGTGEMGPIATQLRKLFEDIARDGTPNTPLEHTGLCQSSQQGTLIICLRAGWKGGACRHPIFIP